MRIQMDNNTSKIGGITHPASTAVLVIDIQNAYCSPKGAVARQGHDVSMNQNIIPKINRFLQIARSFQVPIIFTRMIEDPEYIADNAKLIALQFKNTATVSSPGSFDFEYAQIKPADTDKEIIKKSYDAFSNPDLERILTKGEIKNLIILGVNADVCVDTTVRSGYTRGYNIVIPKDLIGTMGGKVYRQESAMELWNQFFAYVVDSGAIINSWEKDSKLTS